MSWARRVGFAAPFVAVAVAVAAALGLAAWGLWRAAGSPPLL